MMNITIDFNYPEGFDEGEALKGVVDGMACRDKDVVSHSVTVNNNHFHLEAVVENETFVRSVMAGLFATARR